MTDTYLRKPQSGTRFVTPDAGGRMVFAFNTGDAVLSRSGSNLVFTFEDGTALQVDEFYTMFSRGKVPAFVVAGTEVSVRDFFDAMNQPDLVPFEDSTLLQVVDVHQTFSIGSGPATAGADADVPVREFPDAMDQSGIMASDGPSSLSTGSRGGRYYEYEDMTLLDGLDRLGGIEFSWGDRTVERDTAPAGQADTVNSATVAVGEANPADGSPSDTPALQADYMETLDEGGLSFTGFTCLLERTNDNIIMYNSADAFIDGGAGIDVLLSDDDISLDELLKNTAVEDGTVVKNVEMLIKGDDVCTSITALGDLNTYGINGLGEQNQSVTLIRAVDDRNGWKADAVSDDSVSTTSYTHFDSNGQVDLMLETTLHPIKPVDDATQALVITLQNFGS